MSMTAALLLIAALSLESAAPRVSLRDGGIWIDQDPGGPTVKVLEDANSASNLCNSIDSVERIDEARIAVECHINPSVSAYLDVEIASGHVKQSLFGVWFTRSPDRKKVAHAGSIPHFAPPFAKSNYLQIDGKTVYPAFGKGQSPEQRPEAVEQRGSVYFGIHEFLPGLDWSPDSKWVAFIERVYDWEPERPDSNAGKERNERHFLVVAAEKSEPMRVELPAPAGPSRIEWLDRNSLAYSAGAARQTLRIIQGKLEWSPI